MKTVCPVAVGVADDLELAVIRWQVLQCGPGCSLSYEYTEW